MGQVSIDGIKYMATADEVIVNFDDELLLGKLIDNLGMPRVREVYTSLDFRESHIRYVLYDDKLPNPGPPVDVVLEIRRGAEGLATGKISIMPVRDKSLEPRSRQSVAELDRIVSAWIERYNQQK